MGHTLNTAVQCTPVCETVLGEQFPTAGGGRGAEICHILKSSTKQQISATKY